MNVFEEAQKITSGDREQQYGSPERNFTHIAEQWSLYILQKYGIETKLNAEDVCWMMADLKKCRQMNRPKRDNIVDAVGYIGLIPVKSAETGPAMLYFAEQRQNIDGNN